LLDKFVGVRRTFEEREVRFAVEFDIGCHGCSIYRSSQDWNTDWGTWQ
jgi:hypothetical protein